MTRIYKDLTRYLMLTAICLVMGVAGATAASLTITTTADGGLGSLRQAINDATTNAEANTVAFDIPTTDPGYDPVANRFTITLASPLPPLPLAPIIFNNDQPYGITVSGNNSFRVFTLTNSAVVTMNNLTIANGSTGGGPFARSPGGVNDGYGGGFYMGDSAILNLNGSVVTGNTASLDGGGIYMNNSATLNTTATTISNNSGFNGGAIYINNSGTLNLDTSTVNGNTAAGSGGGVFNNTSGTINATTNTIDGNTAAVSGGGVYNTATMTFTNNTISSNVAGLGGGVYNNFVASMFNNLVAYNTAPDGPDLLGRDTMGQAYTGVYNMIGNADGSEGLLGAPNRTGTTANPIDPLLGPLQNNGGPTFTRALLDGSPAIDKGNSPTINMDQRGEPRPFDDLTIPNDGGNGSDMGAFEWQMSAGTPTPTPTASPTATPTATPTPAASIQFNSNTYIEDESQTATITITRTGDLTQTDEVTFFTGNGSGMGGAACSQGVDFVSNNGQPVIFLPGETEHFVYVEVCADMLTETTETANLGLHGNALGGSMTAVLNLNDTASQYRNAVPVTIDTVSSPNPSTITIAGAPNVIGAIRVSIYDFVHESADNVDLLLVGPDGTAFVLMADAGGMTPTGPATITFTDGAGAVLPDNDPLTTSNREPTSWVAGVADFPAPAPAGPYNEPGSAIGGSGTETLFGNFGLSNPNGVWSLYARTQGGIGQIAGGWGLEVLTPTAAQASISGRVQTSDGIGIRNVSMVISGNSMETPQRVTTSSFGYFSFEGLEAGETYVVTVNSRRYTFGVPSHVISLTDSVMDLTFTADPTN